MPTGGSFKKKLNEILLASAKNKEAFAFMFLDLDRFKTVNDTLGHNTGDLLLTKVASRLRDIGIHVSIDDFGAGYSSLSYLSKFSITKLKIDQSFIRDLTEDHQAIVKAIIDLARNLNLDVIAEELESNERAELLMALNCMEAQGYLYAKPLSPEEIKKRLSH